MVETPRSSAENLSTSNEAIYWTEHNQNSKLNQIKWLLENSDNENIKNLMNLIKSKDYKKLQKEIWCTTLDGKLWAKSLEKAQLYVNKEKSVDTVKTETKAQVDDIKESLAAQMQQPGEIWNTNDLYEIWKDQQFTWNFENASKQEMWSGEWILDKWERKLKKWVDIQWNKLKLEKINIPTFDRSNGVVLREETSKTLNNISIKYIWKNICINNEYVIHPQWTICSYKEAKFLDTYAQSGVSFYQDTLLKPLYDYLNKNRTKYEKKEYRYDSGDDSGRQSVRFDENNDRTAQQNRDFESIPDNLEWKTVNENFYNVTIPEFTSGIWVENKNANLHISSIAKKWRTLILNKWQLEITYNNYSDENMTLKRRIYDNSINMYRTVTEKYDSTELASSGHSAHTRRSIYNKLNKEYFS